MNILKKYFIPKINYIQFSLWSTQTFICTIIIMIFKFYELPTGLTIIIVEVEEPTIYHWISISMFIVLALNFYRYDDLLYKYFNYVDINM